MGRFSAASRFCLLRSLALFLASSSSRRFSSSLSTCPHDATASMDQGSLSLCRGMRIGNGRVLDGWPERQKAYPQGFEGWVQRLLLASFLLVTNFVESCRCLLPIMTEKTLSVRRSSTGHISRGGMQQLPKDQKLFETRAA